MAYDEPS